MIEFFCGAYFLRGIRSYDEPFRKATETEKRVGGCFMALRPDFFALVMSHAESFGAMVDSMMFGRASMGWLYLGGYRSGWEWGFLCNKNYAKNSIVCFNSNCSGNLANTCMGCLDTQFDLRSHNFVLTCALSLRLGKSSRARCKPKLITPNIIAVCSAFLAIRTPPS
jgi:hypothetical protein